MPAADALLLERQLCFSLYVAANAITRSYRGVLGGLGLTYPQYLVILALLEVPSMTSGQLAQRLRLDAGTLTPMLKRLEAAGLIKRSRRAGDERVVDNRLTPAGEALRDDLLRAQGRVVEQTGLCLTEIDGLREQLQDLADTLSSAAAGVQEPA